MLTKYISLSIKPNKKFRSRQVPRSFLFSKQYHINRWCLLSISKVLLYMASIKANRWIFRKNVLRVIQFPYHTHFINTGVRDDIIPSLSYVTRLKFFCNRKCVVGSWPSDEKMFAYFRTDSIDFELELGKR